MRSLPDFSMLAEVYSIYQYNGNFQMNNTTYPYSYVRVVDDKGYVESQLTKSQINNRLVGREQTVVADLLEYTFSFGVSSFLGSIPYGMAIDWTVGAVFTGLNSYNPNNTVTTNGNRDIYIMDLISVTTMTYFYINMPSEGWKMCGVRASNFALSRTETFMANIGGRPFSKSTDYPTVYSSTGTAWDGVLRSYLTNGEQCLYYRLGYIRINGKGISTTFVPCFPETIMALI